MAEKSDNFQAEAILIPLRLPVGDDRTYQVLVKQEEIPFIASNRALILNVLLKKYPNDKGTDTIYIDMDKVRNPNQTAVGKGEDRVSCPSVGNTVVCITVCKQY